MAITYNTSNNRSYTSSTERYENTRVYYSIILYLWITLLASFHQQDKRYLINILAGFSTHVGLILTLARLSGLAFTSGLVSKECVVNIAAITSMSFNVTGGVWASMVLTMIYRARVLLAINSSYSPVIALSMASICATGLVLLRLVFRSIAIINVVLLPMSYIETAIPHTLVLVSLVYKSCYVSNISWYLTWMRTIGAIDQTLSVIEASLYCQEWSLRNVIPTIDKNIVYLYNLEYYMNASNISVESRSCVVAIYSGIWFSIGIVSLILA